MVKLELSKIGKLVSQPNQLTNILNQSKMPDTLAGFKEILLIFQLVRLGDQQDQFGQT